MKGQWIGNIEGTNSGLAILDLDDEGTYYRGHAFAFDDDPDLPSIVAEIVTPHTQPVQELEITNLTAIRPRSTQLISREQLLLEKPDIAYPSKLSLRLELSNEGLEAKWSSDLGTEGSATFPR